MHLILIHWKIIRTEQAVHDFFRYWSEGLTIPDRTGLIGEFLSQPLCAEETGLFRHGIALQDTSAYYSFVNLGLWEDVSAFQEQIDRPYRQRGLAKLPFEYARCQGLVLQPCQWRLGLRSLPTQDQLTSGEQGGKH